MKKIILLILGIFTGYTMIHAQVPGILNYQGVARNAVGNVISNKAIVLRLTIHDGTPAGPSVYTETRFVTTNPFGLFNVQIGSSGASSQNGSIANIPWLTGNKFIQVEIDPSGSGTTFLNVGTTELASVPFSLYTDRSGDIVLPFNKTQADNGHLFRIINSGNNAGSTALEGMSQSSSTNAVAVRGIAPIGIGVHGRSTTGIGLYGSSVSGKALYLDGRMQVVATANDSAIAVFENRSDNINSDGIIIKLGRTHGAWNGSSYIGVPNPINQGLETQINQIHDWIYGVDEFEWTQLINLIPSQYLVGTICNLTNLITGEINSALNLPLEIGPFSTPPIHIWDGFTIFGGIDLGPLGDIPSLSIPALDIPSVPVIPSRITVMPAIPEIDCSGLPSLSIPDFSFTDVTNTLANTNEFISFVDKNNRKLGSVRATSVSDFGTNYFDTQKMLDLAADFIGIDIVKDFLSIMANISSMSGAYNSIGVEYTSGHGDYAEWLERADPAEAISYGDIVAVKGGKITKDLANAEQVMAVSKNPIVLGNMPDKAKMNLGNNIAFMGQIPVKVMGSVRAGDYIVAKSEISGYGIAVHPKEMTVEDFKLSVGRSWDTNEKPGPKMVNTVVGVHNHDFLHIIGSLQQKTENSDQRLKAIEAMLNIVPAARVSTTVTAPKKAFR
jgi:hypothetical protein